MAKRTLNICSIALLAIVMAGCTAKTIVTQVDYPVFLNTEGVKYTFGYGEHKDASVKNALEIAGNYCRFDNAIPLVLEEGTTYQGVVSQLAGEATEASGEDALAPRNYYKTALYFDCKAH